MDGVSEGAGALAVDDADALQVGDAGFVQIFVQLPDGVVGRQAQEVELGGDGGAAGEVQVLAGGGGLVRVPEGALDGAAALFCGGDGVAEDVLIDQAQVGQVDLALEDAAADADLVLSVGQGADGAGQAHGDDPDLVADVEVGGLELSAGRGFLFLHADPGILFIDLVAEGGAGPFHGGEVAVFVAVAGSFSQVGDGLVGLLLCPGQDVPGLLIGLLQEVFPALFELLFLVLEDLLFLLQLGAEPVVGLFFLSQLLAGLLQVGQEVLEVFGVLAQLLLCRLDDVVGQAQLLGDGEGVALAGDADHEPVGGLQGLDIELAAGVDDALGPHGVGLELGVVGGRQGPDLSDMAEIEDGDGERRALGGVGAGSQLVKEAEALAVDPAEDVHDGLHVGGEGGQALLDALLVSDVGVDIPEEGELASVAGRDMEAGHAHELEEADGLEGDGLAAGVGTRDDDHVVVGAQLDIDGDDLFGVDQGMAALADVDVIFVIKDRPGRILLHGQVGAGKDEIQLGHVFGVVPELHQVLSRLGRQGRQDLFNLLFFLQGKLPQGVVEADDGGGLDKKRGAGGGLVVDQARDLGLVLGLDRDAVAVAPHGDDTVLEVGGVGRIDHFRELLVDFVAGQLDFPPDLAQGGRGVVRHLVLGDDAAADLGRQGRDRIEAVKVVKEDIGLAAAVFGIARRRSLFGPGPDLRPVSLLAQAVMTDPADIVQKGSQLQKLGHGERGADGQGSEHIAEIPVVAEGDRSLAEEMGEGRLGLGLGVLYIEEVVHGQEVPAELLAGLGIRVLLQTGDDLIIFNDL